MTLTRRNLIPNPLPLGTTGWGHVDVNVTGVVFDWIGTLHYKAKATSESVQAGILWNDASEIVVRPNENYGLTLEVDVASHPTTGLIQVCVLWKEADGVTPVTTYFSPDLPVGTTEFEAIVTAPAGAHRASIAILYLTNSIDIPDTTTFAEWTVLTFLFEPLHLPFEPITDSIANLVPNGSFEYGTQGWAPHTHDDNEILPGTVWEVQTGWSSSGDNALRHTITATSDILPGTTFYGFIGSYVGELYSVVPGDKQHWQCDVNVLDGPATGPGVFLETFYYFYDGDPAHTEQIAHINGDSIDEPLDIGEPKTLILETTCPDGANIAQVTVVMASGEPDAVLDFYADSAIIAKNQIPSAFFDGDSENSGWEGLPGLSVSRNPGRSARVPGPWFHGDDNNAQWEGVPNLSMSTINPPRLSTSSEISEKVLQFMAASKR